MDHDDTIEFLGITPTRFGIVILYEPDYETKTIKEYARTAILSFQDAMEAYANIPNPASQILKWDTDEEMYQVFEQHMKDIKDRKWLDELFECGI